MGRANRFEELIVWQKARLLNQAIYQMTAGQLHHDFSLRDQMRRANISIMSNIAEGFERETKADFARFLSIAKASCGELRCQLYVALDAGHITDEAFTAIRTQCEEVSRLIHAFRNALL